MISVVKAKQNWNVGDIFCIRLKDARLVTGQVIGREPDMPPCATVALFDKTIVADEVGNDDVDLSSNEVFSVLFVTEKFLNDGSWACIGSSSLLTKLQPNNYEQHRSAGFIGAKIIGNAIVDEFVNAYFGLVPWDKWHDPNYLDSLLLAGHTKPIDRIIYKD